MDVFRTPDERFENLPGYDYAPHYVDVDGLRLHHLDEGSGPTVLCFHGEPDWSYLYRHMVNALVGSGQRVVCPDLVGFGKSDKPTDQAWYTYERHVEYVTRHLEQIDLQDVTVVVQDWGGPIGLRWAVEHPDQVGRLVILNTGLFSGKVSKGFMALARVRRVDAGSADRNDHAGAPPPPISPRRSSPPTRRRSRRRRARPVLRSSRCSCP